MGTSRRQGLRYEVQQALLLWWKVGGGEAATRIINQTFIVA